MPIPPKIPGPARPQARPQLPREPDVEIMKVDPKVIFDAASAPPKSPEQSFLERAQPVDTKKAKEAKEKAAAEQAAREEAKLAAQNRAPEVAEAAPDVLDTVVTDDLLAKLEEQFGFRPTDYREFAIPFGDGRVLKLTVRNPGYDDWVWMLAAMERKILAGEDVALMSSEASRKKMSTHLVACRCVLKVDGKWLWDLFKVREQILNANPSWNGESHIGVPDFLQGTLAQTLYRFMRERLDPDILFALEGIIDVDEPEVPDDKQAGDENPTERP